MGKDVESDSSFVEEVSLKYSNKEVIIAMSYVLNTLRNLNSRTKKGGIN